MRIIDDPEAVAALLLLRKKGCSFADIRAAWTADLPIPAPHAPAPGSGVE